MKTLMSLCALALAAAAMVAVNAVLTRLFAGFRPDPRWVVLAILILPPLYFLPAILAAAKAHPQGAAIFFVDALLGWTLIGWVVALVWAAGAPGEQKPYRPLFPPAKPIAPAAPAATPDSAALALETLMARHFRGEITEAEYLDGRQLILDQWPPAPLAAV